MQKRVKLVCCGAILGVFLAGCGNCTPNTENTTKIALQVPTESIITEVPTDVIEFNTLEPLTTESTTAPEVVTTETVTEVLEDTTGEIDVNGYGWVQLQYFDTYHIMENHLTRSNGSIRVFGHRETWYSTNEAAGKATAREIPDKHIAEDGTIRDADGFICVASSDLPFYSIVMTSVGPGKVYDCGCSHGTIDVYTTW